MNSPQVFLLISHIIKLTVVSTSVAIAAGFRIKAVQIRWVSFATTLLLLFYLMILFGAMIPPDYHIFWRAGRDVWSGVDPYAPARFATNPFLNPPTALPLFALFAVLPFGPSFVLWTLWNLLMCVSLPAFCLRALRTQEGQGPLIGRERKVSVDVLPVTQLVAMTAALAVSDSFIRGLYAGQLWLLTAFLLIAALDAQARGRPIVAGVCLALATVKVVTMLPFLVLFHRRADVPAWISMGCVCLGLCLATGRLDALPGRLTNMAHRIEALGAPGMVNDYSFAGTQNESLIGFDHLFYCLGLRDRLLIRRLQYLAVAAVGLWVAWQVVITRLSEGTACSLVALFSMVFLYHRDYDTLILTLPLVYCGWSSRGGNRDGPTPVRRLLHRHSWHLLHESDHTHVYDRQIPAVGGHRPADPGDSPALCSVVDSSGHGCGRHRRLARQAKEHSLELALKRGWSSSQGCEHSIIHEYRVHKGTTTNGVVMRLHQVEDLRLHACGGENERLDAQDGGTQALEVE